MPGVSNDLDENDGPWQEGSDEIVWEEDYWDMPVPTEVYPLDMTDLLAMKDEAFELQIGTSKRQGGRATYRYYKGCILITQVKEMNNREYFLCPYNDTYCCYRREWPLGKLQGEFELIREFSTRAEMEEYLMYCLDGDFPSFAAVIGVDRKARYESEFEYDWQHPNTGEISTIVFDMYSLVNESNEIVLLFVDPKTNMLARVVFPEDATDTDLPINWKEWSEEQLFENMLVADYINTRHYHQMTEVESIMWDELMSSLSTAR